MKKIFALIVLSVAPLFAQTTGQITLTGNIGVQLTSSSLLGGLTVQMPSDADYTLTAAQYSNKSLVFTSATSLTTTRNNIAPLTNGQEFNLKNSTTGGQSITFGGSTGAVITIANGDTASVWSDGVNYYRNSSSVTYPGAGVPVSTGSAWGTSKAVPSGAIVGDSDNQTLTNKHISGSQIDSGTIPAARIPASGVTAATYGDAQNIPRVTIGADGRVTTATTVAAGANFTSDFAWCYLFDVTPTSGGTLPDRCGSNNATVGSSPPTQSAYYPAGWQWNNSNSINAAVTLPTTVNANTKTIYFTIGMPASITGFPTSEFSIMGLSDLSGSTAGVNFKGFTAANQTYWGMVAQNPLSSAAISPDLNYFATSATHVITWVCGVSPTTNDKWYFDGVVVKNPQGNLKSCGIMPTSGQQWMIGYAGAGSGSWFTYFDIRGSNNAHTDVQVQQNYYAMRARLNGLGVADPTALPYQYTTPVVMFLGDSLTAGYGAGGSPAYAAATSPYLNNGTISSNSYVNKLTITGSPTILTFATPGALLQQQMSAADVLYKQYCNTQRGQSVAVLWEGTNNFYNTNPSFGGDVSNLWDIALAWNQKMKAAGCKTAITTMISRGDQTGNFAKSPNTWDQWKNLWGTKVRGSWVQGGFDGIIDLEANVDAGPNGAYLNATYFIVDRIHLTNPGQVSVAPFFEKVVNWLRVGSTAANPNPTIITAATYASTTNDGGLIFDTAANNITDTLFSARGLSGLIISRCNNSTSGANSLTINAPADYPFNNVSGQTSVTVTNGTCKRFQSIFTQTGTYTTVGNYWMTLN